MKTYTFGVYDETPNGKTFNILAKTKCDSDAQAELYARSVKAPLDMDGEERLGVYIRRSGNEWFCRT